MGQGQGRIKGVKRAKGSEGEQRGAKGGKGSEEEAKGVKGSEGSEGSESISILGFRVPTICGRKKFDDYI